MKTRELSSSGGKFEISWKKAWKELLFPFFLSSRSVIVESALSLANTKSVLLAATLPLAGSIGIKVAAECEEKMFSSHAQVWAFPLFYFLGILSQILV